ncbi:TetR family transcriptional regulator, partial [Kibdelosporangium lantanae]
MLKAQIVEAAVRMLDDLADDEALSLRAVAREVSIAATSVYLHFPDRDALVLAVMHHCHEDMGLSLANALAGIQAGADEVQTTLAGIGERAGNTALEELVAVLLYKGDVFGASTSVRPEGLYEAYQILCRGIGLDQPRNKA